MHVIAVLAVTLAAAPLVASAEPAKQVKVTLLSTMVVGAPAAGVGEWGFAALLEVDGRRLLVDTGRTSALRSHRKSLGPRAPALVHCRGSHKGDLMTLERAGA